jgi:drug/metabolite transporter (DMT)-like permease
MYPVLVLQQLIASSTHLIAKTVTFTLHPALVVLVRGLFSCLFFVGWLYVRRKHYVPIERADWPRIILLGLLNIPINQLLFIWGVQLGTAPNAALAYALSPTFVVIIISIIIKELPSVHRAIGVAVALTGAAIVLVDKGAGLSADHTLGNIIVLCASASWALYTVLGRRLVVKYGGFQLTAFSMFIGTALFVPVYSVIAITVPGGIDLTPLTSSVQGSTPEWTWFQLFYLGVITSGFGFGLWYAALARMDAARLSVFNNLQPVLTTVLAWMLFSQVPSTMFVIGGVLAIAGVVYTQMRIAGR